MPMMSHHRNVELFSAFQDGDFELFSSIMEMHKVSTNYVAGGAKTIFEAILSTPKSSRFIRRCIEHDASLYLKNQYQQYPLKFVIDSQCIENLMTIKGLLIENQKPDGLHLKVASYLNLKDEHERNALQSLAIMLTNENFAQIFEMMKFLIVSGVNLHYEVAGKSAMMLLMEKFVDLQARHKNAVIEFMATCESGETCEIFRKLSTLSERCSIVVKNYEDFEINFANMRQLLVDGQINMFEVLLPTMRSSFSEAFFSDCAASFLDVAVTKSLLSIVDLLLENGVDVNRVASGSASQLPPIFEAFRRSQVGIFHALLTHPSTRLFHLQGDKKINVLHHFLEQFDAKPATVSFHKTNLPKALTDDQKRCIDVLLSDPKCNRSFVNATDRSNKFVLQSTLRHRLDYLTLKLLDKGAYIGGAISTMRRSLLEEFLDARIRADEKHYSGDRGGCIEIDYRFLMPEVKSKVGSDIEAVAEKTELTDHHLDSYAEEMKPLSAIADKFELRSFVMHPVISSFILVKWNMISFLIYTNLLLILLFLFSFLPFNILAQSRSSSFAYSFFYVLSFASLGMLILRESMQLFISVRSYVTSRSNWIDIVMLTSGLLLLLFQFQMPPHMARVLRVIVILLAVAEYFNLLGLLPLLSVSIYTKMFRKVCETFVKSLAFYSVMILGFAFSFYALNGDTFGEEIEDVLKGRKEMESKERIPAMAVTNSTRSERFNNFYTIGHAIMKSFVMLTGEYEMSYVQTEGITYQALLLLFLFLVAIVLYNLLNALAVSDTQEIKSEAKLIDLHQRIETMYESEASVFRRRSKFGNWLKSVISLFPHTVPNGRIFIRNYNRIFVDEFDTIKVNSWMPEWLSFMRKDAKLNGEIIRDIHLLLLRKRETQTSEAVERLKEVKEKKFRSELREIHEMMRHVQRSLSELREDVRAARTKAGAS